MNRLSVLFCEIVLLLSADVLVAQRGGHNASAGRPSTGASNPAPSNSDMNDFNRAIALQATPEQITKFRQLARSTQAARKEAQHLIQAQITNKPDSSRYAGLNDAVEEAQNNNLQFVRSFSAPQQSGLKPVIKKLTKAGSDVAKQSKALAQELGRSMVEDQKIARVVERLDKALTNFQSEQIDIGKEMGIQPEGNSR